MCPTPRGGGEAWAAVKCVGGSWDLRGPCVQVREVGIAQAWALAAQAGGSIQRRGGSILSKFQANVFHQDLIFTRAVQFCSHQSRPGGNIQRRGRAGMYPNVRGGHDAGCPPGVSPGIMVAA
mmetsp:Transcript_70230/g.187139  ORF Transcript_70230/g.187139 Transcript_70230/m.187139 type:complete len:122 (+) Transcript_70230:308-673(+)